MNYQAKETQAIMAQLEAEFPVPEGSFSIEWWRARIHRHHELCQESHEREARIKESAAELLEALELCLERLSDHCEGPFGTQTDVAALAVARAAIAKARGEKGSSL